MYFNSYGLSLWKNRLETLYCLHSDITTFPRRINLRLKTAIIVPKCWENSNWQKKEEVHLVELESGKGSSVRVGAEYTSVYGDLGVTAHLDHVPLVELGHYYPCRRVVLVVLLAVWDYVSCETEEHDNGSVLSPFMYTSLDKIRAYS